MKYSLVILIVFLTAVITAKAKNNPVPKAMIALSKKLGSLTSVNFHYLWESNYPANDYHNIFEGDCYVEFNKADKQTVTRFRMECDKFVNIFNGTEQFHLDKKEKTYTVKAQVKQRSFSSNMFFVNSIPTLRSVIQQWGQSDSIAIHERDTVMDNRSYKLVQVDKHKYPLVYMNNVEKLKGAADSVIICYTIIIDPLTGLPFQIIETNNENKSVNKTVFTNLNTKPVAPATNSWYYTTYESEYSPRKKEKGTPLIAVGAIMPEWSLPEYNENDSIGFKSSELKGKLVLVDFWIKNCGFCMKSFPELQRLQQTYGGDHFQLVSINALEKKEEVGFFYRREKPVYRFLYNGQPLAKAWGAESFGYPTVVLIDKTGKVIYSGEFKYEKVEELIRANL